MISYEVEMEIRRNFIGIDANYDGEVKVGDIYFDRALDEFIVDIEPLFDREVEGDED